jgi:hypothetical protein
VVLPARQDLPRHAQLRVFLLLLRFPGPCCLHGHGQGHALPERDQRPGAGGPRGPRLREGRLTGVWQSMPTDEGGKKDKGTGAHGKREKMT